MRQVVSRSLAKIMKNLAFIFSSLCIILSCHSLVPVQPNTTENEIWKQHTDQDNYGYLGIINCLNQDPYFWDGDHSGRVGIGYKFVVNSTKEYDNIFFIKVRYRPDDNWSRILWLSHVNKNYMNEVLNQEGAYRVKFVDWTGVDELVFLINETKAKAKILRENTLKVLESQ